MRHFYSAFFPSKSISSYFFFFRSLSFFIPWFDFLSLPNTSIIIFYNVHKVRRGRGEYSPPLPPFEKINSIFKQLPTFQRLTANRFLRFLSVAWYFLAQFFFLEIFNNLNDSVNYGHSPLHPYNHPPLPVDGFVIICSRFLEPILINS